MKKRRFNKLTSHPPVIRLLAIKLVKAKNGRAVCTMKARHEQQNFIGCIHGGILCALMDAAMGYAFFTLLSRGQTGVTVEFKIHFLAPVFAGDHITAEAQVIDQGRTLSYFECSLYQSPRKLAAKASALFKIVKDS